MTLSNKSFNPFLPNVTILYSLETSDSQKFSKVFIGYKMETLNIPVYSNPFLSPFGSLNK